MFLLMTMPSCLKKPGKKNHIVSVPSAHILLGDDDAQLFETPRKNYHSVTVTNAHIFLDTDSLHCQQNNITHRKGQKLLSLEKYYLCFQMDDKSAHSAQCAKSRALTEVIDSILGIHSFDQKCVLFKELLNSE